MAAEADTSTTASFTVKLLINTRERRVVFAETTRDAVDFLYSLVASPDTSIPFDEETLDGCTSNLAQSVHELDELEGLEDHLPPPPPQDPQRFFVCGGKRGAGCDGYVAERSGARCPSCGGRMDAEAPRGAPGAGCSSSGQDAGAPTAAAARTWSLMDDLTIGPSPGVALAVVINDVGADACGVCKRISSV